MMEVAGLSLPLVFAAGAVSFISPCVLPLVPGYLSTVTGVTLEQAGGERSRLGRRALVPSALFFLGFMVVFVALGASASAIGSLLDEQRDWLNRASGALIVVFGLAMLGVGWSGNLGSRVVAGVHSSMRRRGGPVAMGVAFAFCWTPCVGPILASILTLAGTSSSLRAGITLLLVYGFGLAAPFVLLGFGFSRAMAAFRRVQRYYRAIQAISGVLLVAIGGLLLSGYLYLLNVYAQRVLQALGLEWWTAL